MRHKGFGQGTHLGIAKRCTYCTAVSEPGGTCGNAVHEWVVIVKHVDG